MGCDDYMIGLCEECALGVTNEGIMPERYRSHGRTIPTITVDLDSRETFVEFDCNGCGTYTVGTSYDAIVNEVMA